ncbi:MAG: beta-lactamase family protein, partial [Spirochaetales bacterium]|nr:beta-lactamase family protein [Spirochaetales bacterium]
PPDILLQENRNPNEYILQIMLPEFYMFLQYFHYFIFGLLFLCIQCVPWFLKPVMALALVLLVVVSGVILVMFRAMFIPGCPDSGNTIESINEVESCIADIVETYDLPGMAVAVVAHGDVVWSTGIGYANRETGLRTSPDTPYMLASVSKVVTGVALMHAWENRVFDLDDNINDLLPFKVDNPWVLGEVITIRHLLTHTSGIRDHNLTKNTYVKGDPDVALGDFLKGYLAPGGKWYNAEKNFAGVMPGVTFSYSNVGIALAGHLIETATHIPFYEYCAQTIFDPLEMDQTGWYLAGFEDTSIIAVPYKDGKPLEHYGFYTYPDGQLRSSANGMGRFLAAIINGGELNGRRILKKTTVDYMLKPQFTDVDKGEWTFIYRGFEQGLVWTEQHGYYGHNGNDQGITSVLLFDKATGVGVVILCNANSISASIVGTRLADWILLNGQAVNELF